MQYVDFDSSLSGVTVGKSDNILRLESKLESNLSSFTKFYNNKAIRFSNHHTLSRMCNSVSAYFGRTPQETYERILDRLRFMSNLFNIVYPGVKQETQEVFLGRDVLVYKKFSSEFNAGGNLVSKVSPFKLYSHNLDSLTMESYLEPSDAFSIIGIDLPLLAATLHQAKVDATLLGSSLTLNRFLTDTFVISLAKDTINIALFNRLVVDSQGLSDSGYNEYSVTGYSSTKLEATYEQARESYRGYLEQLTRSSLGDLYSNLPLPFDREFVIDINDYYLSSLMWVNAYVEVNIYNKLATLNDNYKLELNTSSQDNRLKSLLGRNRSSTLTRALPNDIKDTVINTLKI